MVRREAKAEDPDTLTLRQVTTALEEFTKDEVVDFLARLLVKSGMDLRELFLIQAQRIEHKANRLWHDASVIKNEVIKARKMARARALTARANVIREEAQGVVSKQEVQSASIADV
jgi:hypothetical protein